MSRAWCQSRSADLPATRLRLNWTRGPWSSRSRTVIIASSHPDHRCRHRHRRRFPSRGARPLQNGSCVSRTAMESSAAAASAAAGNSSDFVSLDVIVGFVRASWPHRVGKGLTTFQNRSANCTSKLPTLHHPGDLLLRQVFVLALFAKNSGSDQMGDPGCWRIHRTRKLSAGGMKGIALWS